MKISAIIPTYNRRTQVMRAIESALAQTEPVDEIIVVDDGSSDGTAAAIRSRYGSRVVVLEQPNAGVSAARNHGIRGARGNWIAFLDSDDVWLPTKIERQVEVLKALGSSFGLCFTDSTYDDSTGRNVLVFQEAEFIVQEAFGPFEDPAKYLLGPMSPLRLPSTLILRSLLEEIKGFDERITVMEDLDAFFRLTFKTRFCFVSDPLVRIDRNPYRTVGLCNLFATRNDRKYDDLQRVHTRWLSMPEVIGTEYEHSVRQSLRLLCYESAENKIRDFRIRAALRDLGQLRATGDNYASILCNLTSRKIRKLRRDIRASLRAAMLLNDQP